jgi:hypothetical protein
MFNAAALRKTSAMAADEKSLKTAQAAERTVRLMHECAAFIASMIPCQEQLAEIAKTRPGVVVFGVYPPSMVNGVDQQGEFRSPKFHPDQTHFSGFKDGVRCDASKDGLIMMALFEGWRPKGQKRGDPASLPGGKTALFYIAEYLLNLAGGDPEAALVPRALWNNKDGCLDVYVVWDPTRHDAWVESKSAASAEWKAKKEAEHAKEQSDLAAESKMMTLDEHMARKAAVKAAKDAPVQTNDVDGFTVVRKGKGKGKGK